MFVYAPIKFAFVQVERWAARRKFIHVGYLPGYGTQAGLRQVRLALAPTHVSPLEPNVQRRKFYLPSEGRTITLTVSTKGLKVIDRDGIESVVAKIRARGGEGLTMARNDVRPIIKLKSTAGTGYTYVTRKNKRNNPDRITLKKYDPVIRKHVEFREER